MIIYGLEKDEEIFFKNKDVGIAIYNNKTKFLLLVEYKEENFIGKKDLVKIFRQKVEKRKIFEKIYDITKNEILLNRVETPLNKDLDLFGGYEDNILVHLSKDREYLKFYEVDEIRPIKVKVVEKYSNKEEIDKEKEYINSLSNYDILNNEYFYGMWDIVKDKMSSSFMHKSLTQTQICFPDFGKSNLEEGSLFLKLKILK